MIFFIPPQPEYALDPASLAKYYELMEVARKLESNAEDRPAAMGVHESAAVHSLPIHIRGSHLNLGQRSSNEGFPKSCSGQRYLRFFLTTRAADGAGSLAH